MELQKIHHVAIIVSDYEVSKSFYLDVLGLKQIDENFRAERNSWKLDVALPDGGQLEIFTFPGAPGRPSQPEAQGLRHLSHRGLTNLPLQDLRQLYRLIHQR